MPVFLQLKLIITYPLTRNFIRSPLI